MVPPPLTKSFEIVSFIHFGVHSNGMYQALILDCPIWFTLKIYYTILLCGKFNHVYSSHSTEYSVVFVRNVTSNWVTHWMISFRMNCRVRKPGPFHGMHNLWMNRINQFYSYWWIIASFNGFRIFLFFVAIEYCSIFLSWPHHFWPIFFYGSSSSLPV